MSTFGASRRCPITAHEPIKADADQLAGHIIVCGLDGIGVTIVEQLRRCGQQVVVLEQFTNPSQLQSVSAWTSAVVGSKGSLAQTLDAAGIWTASAIVCVVAQDLQNVQLALQARHMNPLVRVVSQLGNNAVRRAMAVDNGPGAVIDGASLAAPAIVEACLGRRLHEMQFGTTTFVAATVPVEGGTLRSTFGDLAPVAVTRNDLVFACPGRDFNTPRRRRGPRRLKELRPLAAKKPTYFLHSTAWGGRRWARPSRCMLADRQLSMAAFHDSHRRG